MECGKDGFAHRDVLRLKPGKVGLVVDFFKGKVETIRNNGLQFVYRETPPASWTQVSIWF
ncbi:hypothetical protein RSSM_03363 [Rhodopirellula sallentina SM41]|uniref:Uncharacterized protein n=1 Tax=Rhodopirellula sallentina SM41 TaxID=1263870 RepID=M5UBL2_9BACT|nr:hypothetical protein RSSM_03363 [Rhodopirellula sallentina SM41]